MELLLCFSQQHADSYIKNGYLYRNVIIMATLIPKLKYFVGGGVLFSVIYDYVGCVHTVRGLSMSPTLNPGPDRSKLREKVWVSKWEVKMGWYEPKVGDIVVFRSPKDGKKLAMKRVAAVAGDVITPSKSVKYKLSQVLVKPGHIWVEADNHNSNGRDSNEYGQLHRGLLVGQVKWLVWPFSRLQNLMGSAPPSREAYSANTIINGDEITTR